MALPPGHEHAYNPTKYSELSRKNIGWPTLCCVHRILSGAHFLDRDFFS